MAASQEIECCVNNSAYRLNFEQKLRDFYGSHANSTHNVKKPWTSARISQVIEHIKQSRTSTHRDSSDYWSSKYDILEIAGQEFLIFKNKSIDDSTIRIVAVDDYFNILTEVHKSLGHGGRQKMMNNLKNKMYIPKKAIEIYLKMCDVCEMKRSLTKKGTKESQCRDQVDDEPPAYISEPPEAESPSPESPSAEYPTTESPTPEPPNKKFRLTQITSIVNIMNQIKNDVFKSETEDEFDIFGKYIAMQLRKLSTEQAILGQEEIQKVVTKCKLNDLKYRNTSYPHSLHTPGPSSQ